MVLLGKAEVTVLQGRGYSLARQRSQFGKAEVTVWQGRGYSCAGQR